MQVDTRDMTFKDNNTMMDFLYDLGEDILLPVFLCRNSSVELLVNMM